MLAPLAALVASLLPAAGVPARAVEAPVPCRGAQVVLLAPLSGAAARVGREHEAWARAALTAYRTSPRVAVELVVADTAQDPARAEAAAARAAAAPRTAAVVGARTSGEALAAAVPLAAASLPLVSATASATALADGRLATFFRVVPNDDAQALRIARLLAETVGARQVLVVDDGTVDSRPLAAALARRLQALAIGVERATAGAEEAAALAGPQTDAVVAAWKAPARVQALARLLREHGKRAAVVGAAGLASPGEVTAEGAYLVAPVPEPRALAGVPGVEGPAVFAAVRAAVNALGNACRDGSATRGEMVTWVRRTYLRPTPLGRPLAFDGRGQPRAAAWSVLQVRGGRYAPVR
ncbi:MAG TPA: ABC transporter substrate-binding protein [Gaiellaceae bacterium]|nr:ABC transporter substrate-binding protein [Gaiellaceae bacterium]